MFLLFKVYSTELFLEISLGFGHFADPQKDVTTIKMDLRLANLKPKHLITLNKSFEYLKSDDGKKFMVSGFRSKRIQETV